MRQELRLVYLVNSTLGPTGEKPRSHHSNALRPAAPGMSRGALNGCGQLEAKPPVRAPVPVACAPEPAPVPFSGRWRWCPEQRNAAALEPAVVSINVRAALRPRINEQAGSGRTVLADRWSSGLVTLLIHDQISCQR